MRAVDVSSKPRSMPMVPRPSLVLVSAAFVLLWVNGCVDLKRPSEVGSLAGGGSAVTAVGGSTGGAEVGGAGGGGAGGAGSAGFDAAQADGPADSDNNAQPDGAGGDRSRALLARGDVCQVASDCDSGFCVDGVCCESSCTGSCVSCSLQGFPGQCRPAAAGTDPRDSCPDDGATSCGRTGVCNDKQQCALYDATTVCQGPACTSDRITISRCSGSGACVAAPAQDCYPYKCGTTPACRSECNTNDDCGAPAQCFAGICGGLLGSYYSTPNFSGPAVNRVDREINFYWLTASPIPGSIPTDGFSVRWTGKVTPRFTDVYTFYVMSDDGARLWVDGQLLVDDLRSRGTQELSGTIALVAGRPVTIRLDYFDDTSEATARLLWSSLTSNVQKQVIPVGALTP